MLWSKLAVDMISYEEARAKILEQVDVMPTTTRSLAQLLRNVIAEPVIARIDSPPFDNSAVDGYGVLVEELKNASEGTPAKLSLKATIRAGDIGNKPLTEGNAFKILTGAYVPPTVEAVVMREFCREENGNVIVETSAASGENIRRRGAEFITGQEVLAAGKLASPSVVALIANLGYKEFPVFGKPKAAIVTTGNELTKPGRELSPGMIYDSNSYGMQSALQSNGIEDVLALHAKEDLNSTKAAMTRALNFADIVISTGGVSVGEFDYVKAALEQIGVQTELWRIAIKPGKPVYFGVLSGRRRKKYVFGLPGNPVSALVTYHQFVKPAIRKLRGFSDYADETWIPAKLTKPLQKKPGRLEFVRGLLTADGVEIWVEPTTGQDSHMLGGLANANALIYFPLEASELDRGAIVQVTMLDWN